MPADVSKYPEDFGALLAKFNQECEALMHQLEIKEITASVWQKKMAALLSRYGQAARLLGLGADSLNVQDIKAVKKYLAEQFGFLDNFAAVIKSATEYNPAWLPRAQMYGASTVTEYWEGKTAGLPLPAQPGQGTQCLGNCHCSWEIAWLDKKAGDADCFWRLGEAEHCQTCLVRSKKWSPVQVRGGNLIL